MQTQTRTLRNLALALAAVALAVWGQSLLADDHLRDGLIVYALAGLLFVVALRRRSAPPAWDGVFASKRLLPQELSAWRRWGGLLALALSGALTIIALDLFASQSSLPLAWRLHLSGIALFLLGVYFLTFKPSSLPAFKPSHLLIALLLILGLAAFMRLYQFDSIPYGLWYDEADNGLQVRRMIQNPAWRPIYVPSTNLPAHFLYLILFSFKLFGETTLALRIVAVVLGLLTVPAAYLAGRELFPGDRRLALILAFFLAVSRWDVNWSRIGMHGVSVPLFELLALGLLLRALRTGRLITFAWAGVAVGLGLCFYTPFRLFPLVLVLFLASWLIRHLLAGQILSRLRAVIAPAIIFGLAVLLTIAPVAQFSLREPESFWARARKISIFRDPNVTDLPAGIAQNAASHALMFNYRGDPNGRHNLPGEPMLDAAVGLLFVLGLAFSLTRLREPKYLLLVLWVSIMLLGGVLSVTFEAPQSLRAIGALPAAYALAIVPLELLLAEAQVTFRPPRIRRALQWALIALLAFAGWSNFHTYFYRQARDFAVWNAFATAETHLAREIQRLRDDYDLYFDPLIFRHLTTQFLLPDFDKYVAYDPATVLPVPNPSPGKKGTVLFVAPDSRATRALIDDYYPAVQLDEFAHPYGGPSVLFTYIFEKQDIEATRGLIGRYYFQGDSLPRSQRTDLMVNFDWTQEPPPLAPPMRVDWQGSLKVPRYGSYQFALEAPGEVEMWLDQVSLPLNSEGTSPLIDLPQGVHALRLLCQVTEPGPVRLLWRNSQEADWSPVPEAAFYHDPFLGHGLAGRFYANDSWSGEPAFSRIDPMIAYYFHHIPLDRPYTVEWRGRLEIPEDGHWALGVEALSAAWLFLDGREMLSNTEPNRYQQVEMDLAAGWYDLTLRFLDAAGHSHVYLYWQPPEGERELIPSRYLYPEPVESR